jgi:ATP-binding cassette subfamily B protein
MIDPGMGEILLDGVPLKQYDLHHLRKHISYVPQDSFLFSDSIRQNIAFGMHEPSEQEIREVSRIASVHNDILGFADQYDTQIGERGVSLSGGQKQRISIARALMNAQGVLLFDDCLSAVDSKTENEIIDQLKEHLSGRTTIFITHRINPAMSFDQIIVLEQGGMIETGTHEELLNRKGYYYEMYEQQRIEEESTDYSVK